MPPAPHYLRLRQLLDSVSTPLIQLWGWPGTGRRAFLARLAEEKGGVAQVLVRPQLEDERQLAAAMRLARRRRARWLLYEGPEGEAAAVGVEAVLDSLLPDQSLIISTTVLRRSTPRRSSVVPPESFLLTADEAERLWREIGGPLPAAAVWQRLIEEAGGWLRPLELAARAAPETGAETMELLRLPAVRSFLRTEVLDPLVEDERQLLERVATGVEGGRVVKPETVISLQRHRGLLVEVEDQLGLPPILARFLRSEAELGLPLPTPGDRADQDDRALEGEEIEVRLLGPPRLTLRLGDGERRELHCPLRRAVLFLAYLCSSPGRQAERGELLGALWTHEDETTIRKNFHPTISLLRKTLRAGRRGGPSPILLRAGVYELNPRWRWHIDIEEVEELVARGRSVEDPEARAVAWTAAWRRCAGPFMSGFEDSWVVSRREGLERLRRDMLRDLGDAHLALGRLSEAEDAYRSLLIEDPIHEEVHLAVMRIYAERGRRDLVRRQYERLCQLLLDELGVEPMASTAAAYQRLMG